MLVAMSGGVDSSVAAARLLAQGHEVTGVTLKLWGGDSDSGCCSVADVEDARRVAGQLGIPHYVFNLAEDFEAAVVDPYVDAYAAGRTPNPCVECNRTMKWGRLLERSRAMGFDALATGHHARIVHDASGRAWVARGADPAKDQAYVLAVLPGSALVDTLLPVGEVTKAEVRAEATRLGLRTATKAESMDVCFIRRGGRTDFLDARVSVPAGEVVDVDGTHLGSHAGITGFTVGQRRGTGVATGDRRYVVDIDATRSRVVIGSREDLMRDEVEVVDWAATHDPIPSGDRVLLQLSAHGTPVGAVRTEHGFTLEERRPRVAPGQVVAAFAGDRVIGAGRAR